MQSDRSLVKRVEGSGRKADCYCTEIPQWERKISELEEEREKICEQEIPLQNVEEGLRQMESHSHNMIRIVYGERLFSMIRSSCNEPYHKTLTNYQNSVAKQIEIGEAQTVQWPIPDGNIYPVQHWEDIEMWKDKLQEIVQEKNLYGEKINIGATAEEIRLFMKETRDELKWDLPHDYVKILEVVNGIEFNGFILYGIDQHLLGMQQNQTIHGLIEYNKIWYENEWQKRYIFMGESNISWYVYDLVEHQYFELDNPSGRENTVFSSLECMVEKLLSDALA